MFLHTSLAPSTLRAQGTRAKAIPKSAVSLEQVTQGCSAQGSFPRQGGRAEEQLEGDGGRWEQEHAHVCVTQHGC